MEPLLLAVARPSLLITLVKVVRDTITTTLTGTGVGVGVGGMVTPGQQQVQICPPRMSTGFFPGGNGTIPGARPGMVPGTWIGPTLIFPGVLNPGIPSTIPLPNTTVSTTGSVVQLSQVPTPTTTTGMAGSTVGGTTIGTGGTAGL